MNMNKFNQVFLLLVIAVIISACDGTSSSDSSGQGTSGSLASMVTTNNQLHILNNEVIVSFDLSGEMILQNKQMVSGPLWEAQTLFNYEEDHLLVGTDTGIIVYELIGNDENSLGALNYVSEFEHIRARDPVIAKNGVGYFTTRDGNENVEGAGDITGVLDLTDITQPVLLTENNDLKEPYGLALFEDTLLVCDQVLGLTQFTKVTSEDRIIGLEHTKTFSNFPCNDVIVQGSRLILSDEQGITQAEFEEDKLIFLSKIDTF